MTICESCALRDAGHTDRADMAEAIRAQRLLLAVLARRADALHEIATEIGDCYDCMRRLAGIYLVMHTTLLTQTFHSRAAAAKAVELSLLEAIDQQDDDGTDPQTP